MPKTWLLSWNGEEWGKEKVMKTNELISLQTYIGEFGTYPVP